MKVLLISLFYEPLTNIASTRLNNFEKYLHEFGHEVDVITRHYTESDRLTSNLMVAANAGEDFEGEYYRKNNVFYLKYSQNNKKQNISNKLPKGLKGLYNLLQMDVYHYNFVERGILLFEKELRHKQYDVIIASSPPPASLILAKEIGKKYDIPWIADFRDSYIAESDNPIIQRIKTFSLNRLLRRATGIIFVSEGMKTQNSKAFTKKNKSIPNAMIYNGFDPNFTGSADEDIVRKVEQIKQDHETLLVYTGSLYPERKLDFFLKGLTKIHSTKIALVIVGIQEEYQLEIQKKYGNLNLFFLQKVRFPTAIKIQSLADFLLLTIWKDNYTGFSGKVFEYLYSGNNIILDYTAPDDLANFLSDFKTVYYCNESIDQFVDILSSPKERNFNSKEVVQRISRKYQIEKLHQFLLEHVSVSN